MLKQGIYKAVNINSIWDEYEITMQVKETEKSFVFQLIEFKSRYSGQHIEMLFKKSKRVTIRKDKGGHCVRVWSDHGFVFYPYQAGIPYDFNMVDSEGEHEKASTETDRLTTESRMLGNTLICLHDSDNIHERCDKYCMFRRGNCANCEIQEAFDRLAAYEDTGLTPKEITAMKGRASNG